MRNVYFDINLFGGPAIAVSNDVFASYTIDNAKGFTTGLMTSEDFVTRLNNETEGAELWALGAGNENDGYPVVDLNKYATGMVSPKAAGMAVGASGGTISVAGADVATVAEVYTVAGALVYSGTVGNMASHAFANGLYVAGSGARLCHHLCQAELGVFPPRLWLLLCPARLNRQDGCLMTGIKCRRNAFAAVGVYE